MNLDQDTVLESQSIWVNVTIHNNNSHQECVQPYIISDGNRGIQFQIVSINGEKIKQGIEVIDDDFGFSKPKCINAKDSLNKSFNILPVFTNTRIGNASASLSSLRYISSGFYYISAKVFTGKDTLYSNKEKLTILKPNLNESQALKDLRDVEKIINTNTDSAITLLHKFTYNYPTSVYTPQAYGHLIFRYYNVKHNIKKTNELIIELSKKFPNNGSSLSELRKSSSRLKKTGKENALIELATKLPKTKVGIFCKKFIEKK